MIPCRPHRGSIIGSLSRITLHTFRLSFREGELGRQFNITVLCRPPYSERLDRVPCVALDSAASFPLGRIPIPLRSD